MLILPRIRCWSFAIRRILEGKTQKYIDIIYKYTEKAILDRYGFFKSTSHNFKNVIAILFEKVQN